MLIVEKERMEIWIWEREWEWEERLLLLLYFGTNNRTWSCCCLFGLFYRMSSCHETWIKKIFFTYKIWLHLHMFHIMPFFFLFALFLWKIYKRKTIHIVNMSWVVCRDSDIVVPIHLWLTCWMLIKCRRWKWMAKKERILCPRACNSVIHIR